MTRWWWVAAVALVGACGEAGEIDLGTGPGDPAGDGEAGGDAGPGASDGDGDGDGDALVLFVAPGGSDDSDGLTPESAIGTVERARILVEELAPIGAVTIKIAAGTYHCVEPTASWTYFNGKPIVVEAAAPVPAPAFESAEHPDRPVFVGVDEQGGVCPGSIFLTLEMGDAPSFFTVRGITITKYRGGMTLRGAGGVPPAGDVDHGVVIDNVVFLRIGDLYHRRPGADAGGVLAGKGAMLLSATTGNQITRSWFEHIRNGEETSGLIHSMYFTHLASRHRVEGNVFHGQTGAIVKITHYSNGNVIRDNSFSHAPAAVVDRWCGARESASVCGGEAQCPSWDNSFPLDENAYSSLSTGSAAIIYPVPDGQVCAFPPSSSGVRMDLGSGGVIEE